MNADALNRAYRQFRILELLATDPRGLQAKDITRRFPHQRRVPTRDLEIEIRGLMARGAPISLTRPPGTTRGGFKHAVIYRWRDPSEIEPKGSHYPGWPFPWDMGRKILYVCLKLGDETQVLETIQLIIDFNKPKRDPSGLRPTTTYP